MKRMLALLLACVIAANMGAVAYGFTSDDYDYGPDADSDTLTELNDLTFGMALTAAVEITPTYFVTVTWENMNFNYSGDGGRNWDPETHTYSGGTWSGGGEGAIPTPPRSPSPTTPTWT